MLAVFVVLEDPELKETVFEFERGRVAVSDLPELALISHPPLVRRFYNFELPLSLQANIEDWEQAEFWSIVRGEVIIEHYMYDMAFRTITL